jgi:NitT/TauT family transport system substrate-binding protein
VNRVRMHRATFGAATVACAVPGTVVRAQDLKRVTLGTAPTEDALAALLARDDGSFRKAGLDVTIQKANSGGAVTAAVIGGALDIGKSSSIPLIAAHVKGIPIVVVAPAAIYNADAPAVGLVVAKNSPIRTAKDCNGKTFSVAGLNDLATLGIQAWIDKNGGDSKSIKLIELPASAAVTAITSGRVDASTLDNPALSEALAAGDVRLLSWDFDVLARRFLWASYFCTADYAQRNPDVIAAFRKVIAQAGAYANAHPADTVETVARFTGIDAKVIRSMTRTTIGTTLDPRMLQTLIDAAALYKTIPAAFDARSMIA